MHAFICKNVYVKFFNPFNFCKAIQPTPVFRSNCELGTRIFLKEEVNTACSWPKLFFLLKIFIFQDLERYIKNGKNSFILKKKKSEKNYLTDVERRTLVREAVDFLVEKYTCHPKPEYIESLAIAIINLFPQLKTENATTGGIVSAVLKFEIKILLKFFLLLTGNII